MYKLKLFGIFEKYKIYLFIFFVIILNPIHTISALAEQVVDDNTDFEKKDMQYRILLWGGILLFTIVIWVIADVVIENYDHVIQQNNNLMQENIILISENNKLINQIYNFSQPQVKTCMMSWPHTDIQAEVVITEVTKDAAAGTKQSQAILYSDQDAWLTRTWKVDSSEILYSYTNKKTWYHVEESVKEEPDMPIQQIIKILYARKVLMAQLAALTHNKADAEDVTDL